MCWLGSARSAAVVVCATGGRRRERRPAFPTEATAGVMAAESMSCKAPRECDAGGRKVGRMSVVGVAACPPGDFEEHAGLLISLTEAMACSPRTVVALARSLMDRIRLVAIVDGEAQRQQA